MPRWHPVSISGYHIREAGSTAAQELAFTLKDGFTYVEQALERGLDVDDFAPRLSFFFNAQIDFFEEIAKYRAARRIWAQRAARHLRREGSRVVADALPHADGRRQPDRAAAAQQHHPHRDRGARGRARRHAVAAHQQLRRGARAADRGGRADRAAHPADHRPRDRRRQHDRPARRQLLRRGAHRRDRGEGLRVLRTIDELGGMVEAVKRNYPQREIADASYELQQEIDSGRRTVVGVNSYTEGDETDTPLLRIDPTLERKQIDACRACAPTATARGRGGAGREAGPRQERANLMPGC
jgi:methylmalonyl-CoA mutase N-terminal domain/subunit